MRIIIEHLDPEIFPWSLLEYKHISKLMGKENVLFTHVANKKDQQLLAALGEVKKESFKILASKHHKQFNIKRICVLDPAAEKPLQPEDADIFDYFVFGGVLGNDPMDGRTEVEISSFFPFSGKRHLGNKQMSTDTAVHVLKKVVVEKKTCNELVFVDDIEIVLGEGYSNILPYRYLVVDDKVVFTPGLIDLLQKEE